MGMTVFKFITTTQSDHSREAVWYVRIDFTERGSTCLQAYYGGCRAHERLHLYRSARASGKRSCQGQKAPWFVFSSV